MNYLSISDVEVIIERLGFVIRDHALLEGAVARPASTAFGEDAFIGLESKAAALLEAINRSHPLLDGNKRLSWICTLVFLRSNGWDVVATVDDAESFVLNVAAGQIPMPEQTEWIRQHLVDYA